MHLTLRQLEVFLAVAQWGTTTAAANAVSLSQSAASASLNELETQMGLQVFDRVGKRLTLDDNGRLLLPRAQQMHDAMESIYQLFGGSDDSGLSGAGLRIGASTTIGNYLLPKLLGEMFSTHATEYPMVSIANTAEIAAMVANFEVDIALLEGPADERELQVTPWIDDELVIVASPQHPICRQRKKAPISLQALAAAGWLRRESGSGTRSTVDNVLLPHLHSLRTVGEYSNSEAIKQATAEQLGIACLPRRAVNDLIELGRLKELSTALPKLVRQFYIVHHKQKILSPRISHVLEFLKTWDRS